MNFLSLPFLTLAAIHFLIPIWFRCACSYEVKRSYFITHYIENVEELINSDSTTEISARLSEMQCLTLCNREDSCTAAIVYPERNYSCFLYELCLEGPYPIRGDTEVRYFAKVKDVMTCYNGGAWDITMQMCRCTGGWIGLFCTKRARTCHDLILSGYSEGFNFIHMDLHGDNSVVISVLCHILPSLNYSRLIVMRNNNGISTFRYSWHKYVTGFSNSFMAYWMGLEKLHLLSTTSYRILRVLLMVEDGAWSAWEYNNFTVLDSSNNYAMYFDSSKNSKSSSGKDVKFGDCLRPVQNISFSTWDKDNDHNPMQNCADIFGAGWWYNDCKSKCNLLGSQPSSAASSHEFKLSGLDTNVFKSQGWMLIFQFELQH